MYESIKRLLLLFVGVSLPIEGWGTFSLLGYPISLNKLSTALLLAFVVVTLPFAARRLPRSGKHALMAAFAVAFGIGSVQAILKGLPPSALYIQWTSFAAVLIFALLVPYTVRVERDLHVFLGAIVAGAAIAVLAGVIGGGEAAVRESSRWGGRFTGTHQNPNALAYNLVVILPIIAAFFFGTRSFLRKNLLMGVGLASVAAIVASLSRGAFVSLVGMWGLWMVRFRRLDTIKYVVPVIVLAVGLLLFAPKAYQERLSTMLPGQQAKDSSIQKRIVTYYWGLRGFLSNPVLGLGYEQFGPYAHEREPLISPKHAIHNAFLGVAAELGLVGLVPLLGIVLLTWLDFTRVWRVGRSRRYRRDGVLALYAQRALFLQIAFLGFLIGAQFGPTLREKPFWLMVGLSTALVSMTRQHLDSTYPGWRTAQATEPLFAQGPQTPEAAAPSPGRP